MDISDIILAQIKLSHLFKLSDLMYYGYNQCGQDLTVEKLQSITAELEKIKAITNNEGSKRLTKQGEFILGMSCNTLVGAFLFECHKLNVLDQGIIAASSLENTKSIFKESVKFV